MPSSLSTPRLPRALRVLVDPPARGAWNMALDEALMQAARDGGITLRLYRWSPPCLSFGRNESVRGIYNTARAARRGIDFVRRPTGGRTVCHAREVTYAVSAPDRLWGGPRGTYARVHRALATGLRRLGVPVELAAAGSSRSSLGNTATRACFADQVPGELTALGRKLVGSALWRRAGALLQHGSVLLHDDQEVVEALRIERVAWCGERGGPAGRASPAPGRSIGRSIGLAEACGTAPSIQQLVNALVEGFEAEFELRARIARASAAERHTARRLVDRYADPGWTWRC